MSIDNIEGQPVGQLTSGIESDTGNLIFKTISFVQQQLPRWRDDPNRPDEQAEDTLNLQLCKFLDSCARNNFPMVRFDHEEYQSGRRRVDLSASPIKTTAIEAQLYTIYTPILVIECKRLPAPPPKEREKEYVTGGTEKTGGIQRFKLGLHGADLNSAVMIAYVQKYSLRYWYHKINEWILELATGAREDICMWNEHELLEMIDECTSKGISRCKSAHSRTGSTASNTIQIYHFGILMSMKYSQE